MTRIGAPKTALLVALALPSLAACGSEPSDRDLPQADTTVAYTYVGPATAPNYHDEYVIQFAGQQATARIGGYGVVKGDAEPARTTSSRVSPEQWKQLVDGLDALDDLKPPAAGCVGGSTYGIHVNSGGRSVVDRTDVACGPTATEVADRYRALIASIAPVLQLPG
ncbi:hypothetical protein [Gordonia phthalatica]|uniref:Lipoprotein n=1 Tax=Gordonia phthalatica TaxID=1136941 RepID=A0A0N9NF18_9ACTN|nr:hypothetical protein [Gordonia phthalatica]ALG85723.1 hypothetical protein ACH46_16085 [Gordonia phthalatica]